MEIVQPLPRSKMQFQPHRRGGWGWGSFSFHKGGSGALPLLSCCGALGPLGGHYTTSTRGVRQNTSVGRAHAVESPYNAGDHTASLAGNAGREKSAQRFSTAHAPFHKYFEVVWYQLLLFLSLSRCVSSSQDIYAETPTIRHLHFGFTFIVVHAPILVVEPTTTLTDGKQGKSTSCCQKVCSGALKCTDGVRPTTSAVLTDAGGNGPGVRHRTYFEV